MWGNKSDSSLPLDLGRHTSYDKRVTWLRNLLEVTLGQEMWRQGTLGRGDRTRVVTMAQETDCESGKGVEGPERRHARHWWEEVTGLAGTRGLSAEHCSSHP